MQDSNLRNLRPKRSGIATNRIREKNLAVQYYCIERGRVKLGALGRARTVTPFGTGF